MWDPVMTGGFANQSYSRSLKVQSGHGARKLTIYLNVILGAEGGEWLDIISRISQRSGNVWKVYSVAGMKVTVPFI
jgi:hypothetical protein